MQAEVAAEGERENRMTTLVVGASGATGRLLVRQLLERGRKVRAVLRSPEKLPEDLRSHENVSIIPVSALELSDTDLGQHVSGCSAVASCLGHNLTIKGMFGHPRMLVTDTVRKLCDAIHANRPERPVRFVLMNTAGNSNRDLPETVSIAQQGIILMLRALLPPHRDNEKASDYLREIIGQNDEAIEWTVVRPDSLIDENEVTAYELHPSPTRSAIFNAGQTSRINTAHFMAELVTNDDSWREWKGRMPVIYNKAVT